MMFVLSTFSVIVTILRIPSVLMTHLRSDAVAVAVIARMLTCDGKMLLISPSRENSLLKLSPLHI